MATDIATGSLPEPEFTTTAPIAKPATYSNGGIRFKVNVPLVPELLAERIEQLKIVMPPWAPIGDRVFGWPLPEGETQQRVGAIHMPPEAQRKHAGQCGIILKMGARAHEELFSHGIEVGHLVLYALFSPRTRQYASPQGVHTVVLMRSGDILGSEELQDAYDAGHVWLTRDCKTGRVELNDRERFDPAEADDQ